MRRGNLILLSLVSALAACSPPAATSTASTTAAVETTTTASTSVEQSAIPADFLGKWDTIAERCQSATSDTHMTIAAEEITYFESGGHVTKVTAATPHDVSVTLSMQGEGETWERTTRLTLSDDSGTLTSDDVARVRCS